MSLRDQYKAILERADAKCPECGRTLKISTWDNPQRDTIVVRALHPRGNHNKSTHASEMELMEYALSYQDYHGGMSYLQEVVRRVSREVSEHAHKNDFNPTNDLLNSWENEYLAQPYPKAKMNFTVDPPGPSATELQAEIARLKALLERPPVPAPKPTCAQVPAGRRILQ